MRLAPNDLAPRRDLPVLLPRGQWHPGHHAHLSAWLRTKAQQGGLKVAVFDWDNTCIFNDIGDAIWRYQLDHLQLRLSPNTMRQRLPAHINGIAILSNGLSLAAMGEDIMAAYSKLWPHMQGEDVHTILASEAHRDFRAKMMHLGTAMERTPGLGAEVSYRAQASFLDGYTPAEVGQLARSAWRATHAEAVGSASWQSATPGQAGHVQQSFFTHIALFNEMIDLIRALQAAEVDVYIVTASCETVVAGLIAALQLPVAPTHVFGMRPSVQPETYPLTYRAGKVRVIKEYLPCAPLLVAGDANTDYEMLTEFPQTEIRLVLNRNLGGDISTLYQKPESTDVQRSSVTTLLQGRDENLACFIPDYRSIPFGHRTPVEI